MLGVLIQNHYVLLVMKSPNHFVTLGALEHGIQFVWNGKRITASLEIYVAQDLFVVMITAVYLTSDGKVMIVVMSMNQQGVIILLQVSHAAQELFAIIIIAVMQMNIGTPP